jgi:hypothetical protein
MTILWEWEGERVWFLLRCYAKCCLLKLRNFWERKSDNVVRMRRRESMVFTKMPDKMVFTTISRNKRGIANYWQKFKRFPVAVAWNAQQEPVSLKRRRHEIVYYQPLLGPCFKNWSCCVIFRIRQDF